ncbi:MAG: 30S ribosomal protein S18 [Candidatus Kapabacteria bacterium]|nr:30S ribosomal protein S18 [Candidatus Kapabacteria bacterium]MCS7169126.1 30S ribosomal protein S18 [Candidatus Kapabacteria bacterium]MDW8225332.1 30S ribosomal protein S18 [Bacteroidota bacterium]
MAVTVRKRKGRKRPNLLGNSRYVDYLNLSLLQNFINEEGKILPRRITGVSAVQQRRIAKAIKYARHLALLPFVGHDFK